MILWNVFYENFIRKGCTVRFIAIGVLIGLFLLRRFGIIERCKGFFSKISSQKWLLLILILGFALRVVWVAWSPYSPPAAGTEDGIMIRHAHELINGMGYVTAEGTPSAERPVGYALLLAGIFRVFGENLDWVAMMNIFFSLITLCLVYRLGVAAKNEFVGLAAAFLLAIYPTSIFASRVVLEEHIFIPMWLAGVLLLISDYQKPSWPKVLCAAFLFAVGAHFRTYSFAMGLVAFVMWFFCKKKYGQAFLRLIVIQAVILLVALPWAIRNYQKMGEPVFFSTSFGLALYYSNNPKSDDLNPSMEEGGDVAFLTAKNEFDRNRAGKRAAMRWIVNNPSVFFQRALGRVVYMLGLSREGWIVKDNFYTIRAGRTRPSDHVIGKINRLDNDFYGVIFLWALFGLTVFFFQNQRDVQRRGVTHLIVTLVYYLSMIALTLGHRKYRFPIEPIFCILAAYGISLFSEFQNRSEKNAP